MNTFSFVLLAWGVVCLIACALFDRRLLLILCLLPSVCFATITDRYVTDAGAGTGTGNDISNPMSFATFTDYMVTGGSKTAAAGDRFNITGAITARTTTSDAWVNGGTITSPVMVRGYNSSIGDLTSLARTNGNGPLVTTNYPTLSYTTGGIQVTGNFIIVEALKVTGANTTASIGVVRMFGTNDVLKRCSITNTSTNAAAVGVGGGGTRTVIADNDISMTGASGGAEALLLNGTTTVSVIGNRITGGTAIGILNSIADPIIAFNTIYTSTGVGIQLNNATGNARVLYNTIVGGGGDGINVVTATTNLNTIIGNMITDNTGDGIDMVSASNGAFAASNRFRDNHDNTPTYPAGYNNSGDWITATNYDVVTTDTGGPETDYVSAGSPNFNYNLIYASPAFHTGNPLYASIGALEAPTPTATPTSTPTATATPSATFTPTPTATYTPTATPTASPACPDTPTPTPTATWTPTSTPTATATSTATATATPSATVNCPIACPTFTPTPTATWTPTATPTATASATSTATPTPTAPIQTSYTFGN